MAPSKIRKAIGAVKDQTSISLAKVGSSSSLSDLEVAIVKATRHEEYPPDERHIREILSLTAYSRAFVGACVGTISRRLSKTKNWVVALKSLVLVHRLLSEGDPSYEEEIFFATRRGTRLLNMSDFRDASGRYNAWDYSAFVRTYAMYLDEQLEFRMQGRRGKHGGYSHQVEEEEEEVGDGGGGGDAVAVVRSTPPDMVKVHEIFCRVAKQYEELDAFYLWGKVIGIARSSEYPEVEKIQQKKLDMMENYVHEKSVRSKNRAPSTEEPNPETTEGPKSEAEPEEDMNAIKALPPPEGWVEETVENNEEEQQQPQEPKEEKPRTQDEGDLLNLGSDAPTTEEHGDKLALALFDGGLAPQSSTTTTPWEAFSSSGDWETALVQSASHLSNQRASLPGGFDSLILDGMYQQGAMSQAVASSGLMPTGSASSVALGSAGRPAMLALPAPPANNGGEAVASVNTDPFAASISVAPPAYVQMSDMEKKQRLLVEEQLLWQQYAKDGMQGQVGLAKAQQQNPYART